MKIRIKTLSPIHIGSGFEISPLEYYREKSDFIRVDMDSLFKDSDFIPIMDSFAASAVSDRSIASLVNKEILEKHPLYIVKGIGEAVQANQTTIKEFIKSAGRVYLPGSSLKGLLLSSLCWYVLSEDYKSNELTVTFKKHYETMTLPVADYIRENLISSRDGYKELLGYVLSRVTGRKAHNNSIEPDAFGQWLKVTDSNLQSPSQCLQVCLVQVTGGRESQIPILFETLKPGTLWEMELQTTSRIPPVQYLKICNAYFNKIANIERIKFNRTPDTNLIRMGQGASMFSTSFYLLAESIGLLEEYCQSQNLHRPVTSKRVKGQIPLGWAEVSCYE